jgi:DeoR family suf operon transcriptional repressor
MPPTRQAVLRALKAAGTADADTIAASLGITPSAVRQQLAELRSGGLVEARPARGGTGRPRHRYELTASGHGLFPAAYDELALALLDGVAAEEPELLDRLFERRRQRRVERAQQRLAGLPFAEQVAEMARILDEDGYVARCEQMPDGAWRIVEHHCAIFSVAKRYGQACTSELSFLREVLPGVSIERVAHLVAGAHHCAYELRPPRARAGFPIPGR